MKGCKKQTFFADFLHFFSFYREKIKTEGVLLQHTLCGLSIFSYHRFDKTDDLGFAAVNGVVIFVFRQEPDLAVSSAQALDGCLITDARYDDLTVVGGLLGADDDLVAAQDTGVYHTVAADTQSKAAGITIPAHDAFLIFVSQDRHTCGDDADDRDLTAAGSSD